MLEKFFEKYPFMIWIFVTGLFIVCSVLEDLI